MPDALCGTCRAADTAHAGRITTILAPVGQSAQDAKFPQVGVFLRCTGLAGEAFFTVADRARAEIEPWLRAEIGPDTGMEWGVSHHPGMTDIAAILPAPLPWNDRAARQQIAWMLQVGAA